MEIRVAIDEATCAEKGAYGLAYERIAGRKSREDEPRAELFHLGLDSGMPHDDATERSSHCEGSIFLIIRCIAEFKHHQEV